MWWCAAVLSLLMAASFAGANSDFTSGEEGIKIMTQRTLLAVHLNDYGEPSANQGHDPRGKSRKPPKKRNI
ncbi:hypothetical protein L1987_04130 [Smallanthus sonchifolius]|uniref:Uncharacterized protein n=1 Tax=Smallanthus sonchifolius TaxID=185202 RepID=A0ACB9KCJ6_9ASTR|nr:hypothetical protein L1987_04130 [Smallanthus sonchifolius]